METLLIEILIYFIGIFCGFILGFNIFKYEIITLSNQESNILEIKIGNTYRKYEIKEII